MRRIVLTLAFVQLASCAGGKQSGLKSEADSVSVSAIWQASGQQAVTVGASAIDATCTVKLMRLNRYRLLFPTLKVLTCTGAVKLMRQNQVYRLCLLLPRMATQTTS